MGIHVGAYIDVERVEPARWARVFDETVQLLRGWPDLPLGVGFRDVQGVRTRVYSRTWETAEGWHIVGDQRSRTHAESFQLPRVLPGRWAPAGADEGESPSPRDILVDIARERPGGPGPGYLLGDKTQGLPYHTMMVAVVTLIEARLPGIAAAQGDIDAKDGALAVAALEGTFRETFLPPVLLDPSRVRARVSAAQLKELESYMARPEPPMLSDLYGVFLRRPSHVFHREIEQEARSAKGFASLGEMTRGFLESVGTRLAAYSRRRETVARLSRNTLPRGERIREMASQLAGKVRLTEMAWDDVEAAGERTLTFLHELASIDLGEWHLHHAAVAIFESPVVRARVEEVWAEQLGLS